MTKPVIIILLSELDDLELILQEQYESRRRTRIALGIWGIIAVVSFLGILAAIDYLVIR